MRTTKSVSKIYWPLRFLVIYLVFGSLLNIWHNNVDPHLAVLKSMITCLPSDPGFANSSFANLRNAQIGMIISS